MKRVMFLFVITLITLFSLNIDVEAATTDFVTIRPDTDEYIINDDGRFEQDYDNINLEWLGLDYNTLVNQGYDYLEISISIFVAEIDDGYQWFFIYNGSDNDDMMLDSKYIEHGVGYKETGYSCETIIFRISLDDLDDTNDVADNFFTIRYGASGNYDDDWKNKDLKISIIPKHWLVEPF